MIHRALRRQTDLNDHFFNFEIVCSDTAHLFHQYKIKINDQMTEQKSSPERVMH